MTTHMVTKQNVSSELESICIEIDAIHADDREAKVEVTKKSNGTIPMLRTWRGWMATMAKYMANNGATMPLVITKEGDPYGSRPFNSDDCHELFTSLFLPLGSNGQRKSWVIHSSSNNGNEQATTGERIHAMDRMVQWATERGILLSASEDTEYKKLMGVQCE